MQFVSVDKDNGEQIIWSRNRVRKFSNWYWTFSTFFTLLSGHVFFYSYICPIASDPNNYHKSLEDVSKCDTNIETPKNDEYIFKAGDNELFNIAEVNYEKDYTKMMRDDALEKKIGEFMECLDTLCDSHGRLTNAYARVVAEAYCMPPEVKTPEKNNDEKRTISWTLVDGVYLCFNAAANAVKYVFSNTEKCEIVAYKGNNEAFISRFGVHLGRILENHSKETERLTALVTKSDEIMEILHGHFNFTSHGLAMQNASSREGMISGKVRSKYTNMTGFFGVCTSCTIRRESGAYPEPILRKEQLEKSEERRNRATEERKMDLLMLLKDYVNKIGDCNMQGFLENVNKCQNVIVDAVMSKDRNVMVYEEKELKIQEKIREVLEFLSEKSIVIDLEHMFNRCKSIMGNFNEKDDKTSECAMKALIRYHCRHEARGMLEKVDTFKSEYLALTRNYSRIEAERKTISCSPVDMHKRVCSKKRDSSGVIRGSEFWSTYAEPQFFSLITTSKGETIEYCISLN